MSGASGALVVLAFFAKVVMLLNDGVLDVARFAPCMESWESSDTPSRKMSSPP